jgi:hypothetical protein
MSCSGTVCVKHQARTAEAVGSVGVTAALDRLDSNGSYPHRGTAAAVEATSEPRLTGEQTFQCSLAPRQSSS